jgi:L-lactate dehydrogenase complex protein LldE
MADDMPLNNTATQAAARGERPQQVYFFATCIIDIFSPQAGLDAIELIENAGVRVIFPQGQTCCGQPAYTTGFPGESRKVVAAQLDLFPGTWPIVVPSGSCGGMLLHHWPRLFEDDPLRLAQARDIASRTVELTAFLLSLGLDAGAHREAPPIRLALHTSCTARREMGTHLAARKLLAQLPGVELVTHTHESECCGFGGTFSVKHPEISGAMAQDKCDAILATGCEALISADCGCLANINGTLARRGEPLRGEHLASFLLRRQREAAAAGARS